MFLHFLGLYLKKQYNNTHLIGSGEQLAEKMNELVRTDYVWGGNSPADGGMDCSCSNHCR